MINNDRTYLFETHASHAGLKEIHHSTNQLWMSIKNKLKHINVRPPPIVFQLFTQIYQSFVVIQNLSLFGFITVFDLFTGIRFRVYVCQWNVYLNFEHQSIAAAALHWCNGTYPAKRNITKNTILNQNRKSLDQHLWMPNLVHPNVIPMCVCVRIRCINNENVYADVNAKH